MPRTTPFHSRLEPLSQTRIWKNWSGFLVAPQYQHSITNEYYAIRNSVSLLDTSPLFKYRFTGAGAQRLLERALVRDIRKCALGRAQYTCFCDERGFVVQDGVAMHVAADEYWLTAADPALRYFQTLARDLQCSDVCVEDISDQYGILALQGPHAYDVLSQITDAASSLRYFGVTQFEVEGRPITVSRSGYTGDLGYELWIRSSDAEAIWDILMRAGKGYNLTPIGTTALKMARVEAGLLLMGTDFHTSRYAWVDEERETPNELGWSWMLGDLQQDDRQFIGRAAIESEMQSGTSRWQTVGLTVDWHDYERVFSEAGILPPRHEVYGESTMSIYRRNDKEWDYAGYASSFLHSPLLRKPIAIAKLPLDLLDPGAEVDLEVQVIRRPQNVLARVESMPFFNPDRKTAPMNGSSR